MPYVLALFSIPAVLIYTISVVNKVFLGYQCFDGQVGIMIFVLVFSLNTFDSDFLTFPTRLKGGNM